jgi:hypothetical protein
MLGCGGVSREGQDLAAALSHRLLDHLRPGDLVVVWKLDWPHSLQPAVRSARMGGTVKM